jgi:hypothetical protein
MSSLYLRYAPPLRHGTSCCSNRFQAASRIDMPWCGGETMTRAWAPRQAALGSDCSVAPHVLAALVDRLCDFVGPSQHALEPAAGQRPGPLSLAALLAHMARHSAAQSAARGEVEPLGSQAFLGTAPWAPRPLSKGLVGQGGEPLGEPAGILAFAPRSVPKRGTPAVGVPRPWCRPAARSIPARGGLPGGRLAPRPCRARLPLVPASGVGPGRAPTPGMPQPCGRVVAHAS